MVTIIGLSCSSEKQTGSENTKEDTVIAAKLLEATATPPKDWIEQRVSNAQKRLAESEEGQLLWKAIEAHGGLSGMFCWGLSIPFIGFD